MRYNEVRLDLHEDVIGAYQAPAHILKAFDEMRSEENIKRDAELVYEEWKANGFREVQLNPRPESDDDISVPECFNQDIFTADIDRDDYIIDESSKQKIVDEIAYETDYAKYVVDVVQAADICSRCPLRIQCLASATTQNRINVYGNVDFGGYGNLPEIGVFGGYGPYAREQIANELVNKFSEEYLPNEEVHQKLLDVEVKRNSDLGFYGFDENGDPIILPTTTGLIKTKGYHEKAA